MYSSSNVCHALQLGLIPNRYQGALAAKKAMARSVLVIDPMKNVQLSLTYPTSTGRNFNEIIRTIDALQVAGTTYMYSYHVHYVCIPIIASTTIMDGVIGIINAEKSKIATPANWKVGEDVIILPDVTEVEAKVLFPKGFVSIKPYLRITSQPTPSMTATITVEK